MNSRGRLPPVVGRGGVVASLGGTGRGMLTRAVRDFGRSRFRVLFEATFGLGPSVITALSARCQVRGGVVSAVNRFCDRRLRRNLGYKLTSRSVSGRRCGTEKDHCRKLAVPKFVRPRARTV